MDDTIITGRWGDPPEPWDVPPEPWDVPPEPWDNESSGWYDHVGGYADDHDLGRLTRITVIRDRVVDVERLPIEGSGFEAIARDLGAMRPPPPPEPPAFAKRLAWLERVVGGPEALAALDDSPLVPDGPLDLDGLPGDTVDRLVRALDRVEEYASALFGREGAIVAGRVLLRSVAARPTLIGANTRDEILIGAVVLAAGKANNLVGPGRRVLHKELQAVCRLTTSPGNKARTVADLLTNGQVPWPWHWLLGDTPDVLVLGSPDLLVSDFRRILIRERDTALRLQEATVRSTG